MAVRVVLLGASNLVRAPWIVVETARLVLGTEELEVFGAYGHGRSYGMTSTFLGRSLPGILASGLWRALAGLPPAPTYALLTDVGNDIPYGADAAAIAGWVEECVRRLADHGARVVMTGLPVVSLERFRDWQLGLARRFFFPTSKVTVADVWRQVGELDRRLREMAERWHVTRVEHEADWYGLDPIHVSRRRGPRIWARILAAWTGREPAALARPSFRRFVRLRRMLPESWRWLGLELGRRQPAGVLPGPVPVSLY